MEMKESLLNNIEYPSDLKKLKVEQLPQVCEELRAFIIDELSHNPGHFASSLGTIEITVALHYVFDMPSDNIVWDVGHQAYGHKILTGRRKVFNTNRKFGGISGFPNPKESEYDSFIAGHASNSISASLGMAVASKLEHKENHTVAIIGDGAMTGGLAFEGLNNASICDNNLLIILNDNHMAIDPAVGGVSDYLLKLTSSPRYNRIREGLYNRAVNAGIIGDDKKGKFTRLTNSVKSLLSSQQNMFEGLNIRYFGPSDGHNVIELVSLLEDLKRIKGPKLLHLITKKGKGFKPAEEAATEWHAPGKFDVETGEKIKVIQTDQPPLFQDVFGHTLLELARENEKIVGVTPAMPTGCSMTYMMHEMPNRAFDVGIAEGHAVTFSAGMAKAGLMPFCNIYSSFMQRGYDNVIHDVAIQNLNMVICLDRAGLVGADGATHHGAFDLAAFRVVPNLTIASPINESQLRKLMYTAQLPDKGPFMIRYPRGKGEQKDWHCPFEEIPVGKGEILNDGDGIAVLTVGPIGNTVAKAIKELNDEGLNPAHYNMIFVKPLDEDLLREVGKKFRRIITVEDGVKNGGMGSAVTEFFNDADIPVIVKRLGLPDKFVEHGTPEELYKLCGLDKDSIKQEIKNQYNKL
ncbi:MAG: 1-deoxy-D-xylulose-5-phosphate synthase [Paludibacteraceae bacterium]|nr:1-deoxy-D-xylulose-5-phosphate synthase [Paludibacteraceae bacterium]MBR6111840.1 1-deoxy-D-xylulose-5-phosphate synthase [Paludibacteraceae bacterium]